VGIIKFRYKADGITVQQTLSEQPMNEQYNIHTHDTVEIYFFLSGACKYLIEGNEYELAPGDLIVMRPSESLSLAVAGLALPSGLLALAFPGWYYCPMLTWASICGFVGHANLVAFALSLILSGDVKPRLRNAWVPLAYLACYLAVIFPFNRAFDTNFAFINWPIAGTPLVAMEKAFGNPGYLAPYLALMMLIISGLFWLVDHVFED
jgi:hypothetical protein